MRPKSLFRPAWSLGWLLFVVLISKLSMAADPVETPARLDVRAARQVALERQPLLRGARAAIEKSRGELKGAGLLPNPTLALEGEEIPKNWDVGAGLMMLTLNQTLITGGKRRFRVEAASKGVERAIAVYEQQALEIIREVNRGFYGVLGSMRKRDIAEQLSGMAAQFNDVVSTRVSEGVARPTELDRSTVLAAQAEFETKRAETDIQNARQELATAMGMPATELGDLEGVLEKTDPFPPVEDLARLARERSPALVVPVLEEEIARKQLKLGKAQRIPDVEVGLGVQHRRDPDVDHGLRGMQLTVPLTVFDHGQAVRQQARAEIDGAQSRQDRAWQVLENRLVQAHQNGLRALKQIETYEEKVIPAARRAVSRTSEGYDAGEFTYLDVLDAQRSLATVNQTLIEALVEYQMARADIEEIIAGDMTEITGGSRKKKEEE